MSNTSAFHLNVLLSARSQTLEPINFWAREKGPALSAGPRWGRHVHGRLGSWVERFPAPRARPQIASVELVPWSVRSPTPDRGCAKESGTRLTENDEDRE